MEAVRQYAEQFVLEGEGLAEREDGAAVTSAAVRVDALPVASSPSDDLSHLLDRYGKFHSRLRVGVPIGAAATTIAVLAAILFMPAYSVLGFPVIQLEIVAAILLPLGLPLVGRLTDGQWQMVNELLRKCEPGDERVLLSVAQCMGFPGLRGRARDAIRDLIVRWPAASWRRAGEPSVAILTKQLSLMLRSRNLRTGDGEQARAILLALAEIATSSAHQALLDLSRSGSEGMDAELRGLAAELLPGVERRMGLRKQAGQLLHPVEKADDTLLRPHLGNVQSDPELLLRAGDE
jgi:hypothetical protein